MTNLALRGLLSQSQHMFCRRQGQILVREGLLNGDVSDLDSNDSVDQDDVNAKKIHNAPKVAETHSYVDVLAHRLNEVDQRLLKYSIDMNIKHKIDPTDQDPDAARRDRTQNDIVLNRQSTMLGLAKAREIDNVRKQHLADLENVEDVDGSASVNRNALNIVNQDHKITINIDSSKNINAINANNSDEEHNRSRASAEFHAGEGSRQKQEEAKPNSFWDEKQGKYVPIEMRTMDDDKPDIFQVHRDLLALVKREQREKQDVPDSLPETKKVEFLDGEKTENLVLPKVHSPSASIEGLKTQVDDLENHKGSRSINVSPAPAKAKKPKPVKVDAAVQQDWDVEVYDKKAGLQKDADEDLHN